VRDHEGFVKELRGKIEQGYKAAEGAFRQIQIAEVYKVAGGKRNPLPYQILLFRKNVDKEAETRAQKKDPFAPPYEPGMVISDRFEDHLLMFNKFFIVRGHVLVVTKRFESQQERLRVKDFEATLLTMWAVGESFAFYNHGVLSGRSQPHKHVQVMPLGEEAKELLPYLAVFERYVEG